MNAAEQCQRGSTIGGWKKRGGVLVVLVLRVMIALTASVATFAETSSASSSSSSSSPSLDRPFQQSFSKLTHAPCVSLFSRNGRLGCGTADRDIQGGPLIYQSGWDSFENVRQPFVAVMEEDTLTYELLFKMYSENQFGSLQGILVLNATNSSSSERYYSPAPADPQGKRTPSQKLNYGNSAYKWNAYGDGATLLDLHGVPMAYVLDSDVSDYLREVAMGADDSAADAEIVADFNYYMGPSEMTSAQCLAWHDSADDVWRPKCLPLGGTSVWALTGSPEAEDEGEGEEGEGGGDEDDGNDDVANADDDDKNDDVQNDNNARPVVLVATNMDSSSLFYGTCAGANTAASNILALLMAAKMVGEKATDDFLDSLPYRIVFAFFQGESFGFLGSRAFLRDVAYPGFQCQEGFTVPSVAKRGKSTFQSCLYPMRHTLEFQKLGEIVGMIALDQVGHLMADQTFYVHDGGDDFGDDIATILQASSDNGYSIYQLELESDDDHFNDGDVTVPPSPLTSMLSLSGGAVGGAILTGYGGYFAKTSHYHSHKDSVYGLEIDLEAVATAATLIARAAIASAYDGGQGNAANSAAYALTLLPDTLGADDESLLELANCLYVDGNCDLLQNYARQEAKTESQRTGISMEMGESLGAPPNYYVSVYNAAYGQPFVHVDGVAYGSYNQDGRYGNHNRDAVTMRPSVLEMAIKGLLNDYLGRNVVDPNDGSYVTLHSCKTTSDCSRVDYCVNRPGYGPVCSAGGSSGNNRVCVCSKAHYHQAMDESLIASPNRGPGYFEIVDGDEELSALYTEPFWSASVGVKIYKDAGKTAGLATLAFGLIVAAGCAVISLLLRKRMKKEKIY